MSLNLLCGSCESDINSSLPSNVKSLIFIEKIYSYYQCLILSLCKDLKIPDRPSIISLIFFQRFCLTNGILSITSSINNTNNDIINDDNINDNEKRTHENIKNRYVLINYLHSKSFFLYPTTFKRSTFLSKKKNKHL